MNGKHVHIVVFVLALVAAQGFAQKSSGGAETAKNREDSITVLHEMRKNLREYYFDRSMKGIDLDAKVEAATARIKSLTYNWEMYRVLAQFLLDLDDSHTIFQLPPRADHFTYGFDVQMIGNECLVTSVTTGSDAEKKGLQIGDRIDSIGRFTPNRNDLWKILYVLYKLRPEKQVGLQVTQPDGTSKTLLVEGTTQSNKEFQQSIKKRRAAGEFKPFICAPVNVEILACKFRSFNVEESVVSRMMKEASGYKKLILDLRGNPGGLVSTELFLTGAFFDRDVKVGDFITRKKTETRTAKGWRSDAFKGELAVLIDSDSGSAAEVFTRVIQIEKRGQVFGDVSAGAVLTSIFVPISANTDQFTTVVGGQFGMSVTIADLVMADGNRIEKKGLITDIPVIPTQQAVAKGLDPVLALAASKLGSPMTPEAAAKFLFIGDRSESKLKSETDEPR